MARMTGAEIQARYRKRHPERVVAAKIAGKQRDATWRSKNRDRINSYSRAWYEKNKLVILESRKAKYDPVKSSLRTKKDYQKNSKKRIMQGKQWRAANAEKCKELKRSWIERNKDYYLARSAEYESIKRASFTSATPSWANKFFIREIYHLCGLRTKLTGVKHHVDHIIPIQSKLVCGLHVENNLRVIPARINIIKSNHLQESLYG